MMHQVVASPTIIILMTLEVSLMLLENTYSTGITIIMMIHHNDYNILIVQAGGVPFNVKLLSS